MSTRSVTLKDVADKAGVHLATASRALNSQTRGLVNDETANRIIEIAKRIGYRGNPMARALRTSRSMTIGVLIPDLTNPFYPPLVRGIEDRLSEKQYVTLIASTDNDLVREGVVLDSMRGRRVDGYIISTARVSDPVIQSLVLEGLPVVLVSRTVGELKVPSVTLNDENAMEIAVDHLFNLGHKSIGHIAGPRYTSTGVDRKTGFLRACKSRGISIHPVVEARSFSMEQGVITSTRLLEKYSVTALVASNDLLALGCLRTFQKLGLRCPDDISLIGVNDMAYLELIDPPLTTINVETYQMGFNAAQMLLLIIDGSVSAEIESQTLQPYLVLRKSTSAPRVKSRNSSTKR